jgi:glycerol-1-phosphate dehydrogenase [NAD(P)+]
MSGNHLPEIIDIGPGAVKRLALFCAARHEACGQGPLHLVADLNTWEAMGKEAERELRALGLATRATVFDEPYLAADARSILRLLVDAEPGQRLYVAIGSGTVTDIVRFAARVADRDFVSLATAPSVDAYASVVAPIVVEGIKRTLSAVAPIAVFADSEALARAPRPMIAAGFGDMVCKFSAVADWHLGALVWGEGFDEAIASRSVASARSCVEAVEAIGAARPEGLATLMAALVESGLCMAEAGHSRPASGAEHQYSHYWEMRLLQEGRPPILHGLKVGIGAIEAARLWGLVRGTSKASAAVRLARSRLPSRKAEEGRIRRAYGAAAPRTIAAHERFLAMGEADCAALKERILESWDSILGFAAAVPSAAETARLLALAGCPTEARGLGLGRREISLGLSSAHYIRDRFTVKKLARFLGMD